MLTLPTVKIGKFLSAISVVILMLASLSACDQGNTTNGQSPIKIGISSPLTGDFSADGKALKQGYDLWAEQINKNGGLLGRQVQLDVMDDQSKQEQATTDYNTMISTHHDDLLFASFSDGLTVAGAKVAKRYGYAFLEGAGTSPTTFQQGLDNLFTVSLSASNYLTSFTNYILSLPSAMRPKSVAYATSDDPFTQPQIDSAKALLEHGGVNTVSYQVNPAEAQDYTVFASKIIQSNADVVILGTLGQADCVAFIKAFKQQHYNPKAIIATAGPDQGNQFTDPLGGTQAAEGIFVPNDGWFPTIKTTGNDEFTKAYVAKYGGTADDISSDTVQAYSVGQAMEQAIKKANSIDNAKLIQTLRKNAFSTLQGPVKFTATGENSVAQAFLFQWQNGALIPVYPAGQAQANPEFPKKNWP